MVSDYPIEAAYRESALAKLAPDFVAELYAQWDDVLAEAFTMREPRGILSVLPRRSSEPEYVSPLRRLENELSAELKAYVWRMPCPRI